MIFGQYLYYAKNRKNIGDVYWRIREHKLQSFIERSNNGLNVSKEDNKKKKNLVIKFWCRTLRILQKFSIDFCCAFLVKFWYKLVLKN